MRKKNKDLLESLIWVMGIIACAYHLVDSIGYDLRWNLEINPLYAVTESLWLIAKLTYYYVVASLIAVMLIALIKRGIKNLKRYDEIGLESALLLGLRAIGMLTALMLMIAGVGSILIEETFKEIIIGLPIIMLFLIATTYVAMLAQGIPDELKQEKTRQS